MRLDKRIWLAAVLATLLLLSAGSAFAEDVPSKVVIGLTMSSLAVPFDAEIKRGAEDAAVEWNLELIVDDAKGDAAAQAASVDKFVAGHVGAILINPVDPKALEGPVQAALKAGILVLTVGPATVDVPGVTHVDTNNRMIGRKAFEVLAAKVSGEATIIEVALKGAPESKDRSGGFATAVKEQVRFKVVARLEAADRQEATALVQQALKDFGAAQAVFAHNAELAVGAVKAYNLDAPTAPLVVVGVGGNNDAIKMIKLGKLTATVYEKPWDIGHIATEQVLKVLKGGKLASFIPVDVVVYPTQ